MLKISLTCPIRTFISYLNKDGDCLITFEYFKIGAIHAFKFRTVICENRTKRNEKLQKCALKR